MSRAQLVESFKVASTLAAQRIVALDGTNANTVAYPSGSTVMPIGITLDTVKDTNEGIPVVMDGIAPLYFNDTVAAGGLVASDTSGRGIPFTPANTSSALTITSAVVGILAGAAVAATGTIADVIVKPQLLR